MKKLLRAAVEWACPCSLQDQSAVPLALVILLPYIGLGRSNRLIEIGEFYLWLIVTRASKIAWLAIACSPP